MVVSKFTEHLDGQHDLVTYNEKSVSLEDILRDSKPHTQADGQRSNIVEASVRIVSGRNSNSSER
jgi:hypothetical protein